MDYDSLFEAQGGRCAICGKEWNPVTKAGRPGRKMHRDHNHRTLKPRGLLCGDCNRNLKDRFDTMWYLWAYEYLRRYDG